MTSDAPIQWPTVHVQFPEFLSPSEWELFCDRAMGECEALGIEEHPDDPCVGKFFFAAVPLAFEDHEPRQAQALRDLALAMFPAKRAEIHGHWLHDQDWSAGFRPYYHLIQATRRVYVGPPEEAATLPEDAPADAIAIGIEYSGGTFGTGTHESTQGCLRLVEKAVKDGRHSLLDIGTGTGVLCFAAVKLGMEYAVGMDCQKGCGDVFYGNALRNGCDEQTHYIQGSTIDAAVTGCMMAGRPLPDCIACNMLSNEFGPMLPTLARLRRPLLLAGFLASEEAVVRGAVESAGFVIAESLPIGEWLAWECHPTNEVAPE
ncbi:MAG: 50S ribosomal protein L11 methyltransferase [Sumerlaeia bacterium]